MTIPAARRILKAIDSAWSPFRAAVGKLGEAGIEEPIHGGWSVKEMLAHVSFWDEAVIGVLILMFRGSTLPEGWTFGSGYQPESGAWPPADVHNAREAAWARGQPADVVLARLARAHQQMLDAVATVTDAEVEQHASYFEQLGNHYRDHLADLQSPG